MTGQFLNSRIFGASTRRFSSGNFGKWSEHGLLSRMFFTRAQERAQSKQQHRTFSSYFIGTRLCLGETFERLFFKRVKVFASFSFVEDMLKQMFL